MLLKYFYDEQLAHASYLVGCQESGEAIVVDPGRDVEPYLRIAKTEGLNIVAAAETHIHADYLSGSMELAMGVHATLYLSDEGDEASTYQFGNRINTVLLKDGDEISVGGIRLQAMHTPGHTPEHLTFLLTDGKTSQPMGAFTGDFIFAGDIGRPDLLEKAVGISGSSEAGARQMFRSLKRFQSLPDYLQIWPAHGAGSACGKSPGAVPSSTVGYEKRVNWAFQESNEEKFIEKLLEGQPEPPAYFATMKKWNREGPPLLKEQPKPKPCTLSKNEVASIRRQGGMVIDTRSADSFAAGHIFGTINIPFDRSFLQWAGWLINYENPLYLIADAQRVEEIRRQLQSIGIDQILGWMDPLYLHKMMREDSPLQSYRQMTPEAIADSLRRGEVSVIDVRSLSEWKEGHIPEARHIMLGYLQQHIHEIPQDKPILLHCRSGKRSAIAASLLQAAGISDVINLTGGFDRWVKEGYPHTLNQPTDPKR
ncbi:MBL fold metallo-hydrolase [Kroppenstedtia pulmonis]|uniref:MBL fold metallo-hydrolase n=1 Tax=Kroppenstedtia pulmonis TaxID=1380685 RepID=A0A7D4C708_9BACL|nr:MBL fold metallo-hydrolase [Kroppenstedtia pulmonis]QKG84676.1 MBL fold metallo-hydrolase [Kroppenstedtia pulmonis]